MPLLYFRLCGGGSVRQSEEVPCLGLREERGKKPTNPEFSKERGNREIKWRL